MPKFTTMSIGFPLIAGGNAYTISTSDFHQLYEVTGSATITGDNTFTSTGTIPEGTIYHYKYRAAATYGGGVVKFHGVAMTAAQALVHHDVIATYIGGAWDVDFLPDLSESAIIDGSKLVANTVTFAKMQTVATNKLLGRSTAGTGDIELVDLTAAGRALLDDASASAQRTTLGLGDLAVLDTIDTSVIDAGGIETTNIAASAVTTSKLSTEAKQEMIIVEVSFESGEQCNNVIEVPYAFTITAIKGYVTKAIAGTDNGTIIAKINGVSITTGTITCVASDALNTPYSVSPSAGNTISATDSLSLVCAKTTAGGKVRVVLWVTRVQE